MINFIYFDVGGVVIKDFSSTNGWEKMMKDLGVKEDEVERVVRLIKDGQRKFDVGLDFNTLRSLLNKEAGLNLPEDYSLLEDLVSRFEVNQTIWPVIERVHKKVKVGLLTNMYPRMLKAITAHNLLPNVNWDVIIDSSIEKCLKPEPKIFEIAAERCGQKPENILFVDNSEINLEAAKKLGWQTFLYDSGEYEKASNKLEEYLMRLI